MKIINTPHLQDEEKAAHHTAYPCNDGDDTNALRGNQVACRHSSHNSQSKHEYIREGHQAVGDVSKEAVS